MASRIRKYSIFVDSKKIGTVQDGTFDYSSGDESQIGDEGYLGHSDGADTSTLSCNVIVPVDGRTDFLRDAIAKKKYLKVKLGIVDGKILDVEMRCVRASYSTDS